MQTANFGSVVLSLSSTSTTSLSPVQLNCGASFVQKKKLPLNISRQRLHLSLQCDFWETGLHSPAQIPSAIHSFNMASSNTFTNNGSHDDLCEIYSSPHLYGGLQHLSSHCLQQKQATIPDKFSNQLVMRFQHLAAELGHFSEELAISVDLLSIDGHDHNSN